MKNIFPLLLMSLGICWSIEFYLSPKYFQWEELNRDGSRLLVERGLTMGAGVRGDLGYFTGEFELYGGSVNYDGQTQGGTPVQTDTNYGGLVGAVGLWHEAGGKLLIRGEVLYRVELWIRDIQSTQTAVGYSEVWFFDGIVLGAKLSSGKVYTFSRYILLFRDAQMQASLTDVPLLRPKRGPSYELGLGVKGSSLGVEVSYSYTKFNRSEPKPYQGGYVLQPESIRKVISVRFIFIF